ncbi:MarR family winged helix-turn-helix transcriptional regulator [Williamsia sterculiae]|uniref:Transcriptional regulator, MarR family n=1 Tax=Williamsia sterculiae TaxID=1344003 RepID=A0A1N7D2A8_9NOCA|nr:MarR family transcriptional regulator [Williamsia sterculiae]SIR69825.1 transcriptional regulator, MarR family [Williamsia sterculiae]
MSTTGDRPVAVDGGRIDAESLAAATRLRDAMMDVARLARRHRPDHGLTMTQATLLGDLDRYGISTVADLAERAQVRVQSLTLSMNRLDELGMITRTADPTDRRRQLIELSDRGRTTLLADRRQRDEWLAEAMAERLDTTERALLDLCVPLLRKVVGSER